MEKLFAQRILKFITVNTLLIVCLILPMSLEGQLSLNNDTVKIREVIITRKQISSEQPGFKFYDIDSMQLKENSLFSLTDLLNETTPLFMKYYGSGGSATSSFRGTSAGHTQVAWNGINLNDPMLGQTDFSMIPSGMADNIMISFGGASMDLGNGAIGGIINIENEPVWNKHTIIDISPGTGSFGRYTGLAKFNTGSTNFQSVTKAYLNSSDNDFPFYDSEALPLPLWKKRENNMVRQKGFMQELYLRKSKNVFSARFWYQSLIRNLPGSTLYGYAGEKQSDESFRSLLDYDFTSGKNEYFVTVAWMLTDLHYSGELYSIDSRNKVNTIVTKGGITTPLGTWSRLKLVFSNELNSVKTNNYNHNVNRNNASVTLSAERKKGRRFGAMVLLRETLDEKSLLNPDFSSGVEYRVIRGEEHFIKMNISRNSRIPSLNDRFWNPGGNPGLRNEYAYSYEIGYKLDHKLLHGISFGSEINYFNNHIRDMIQWRPVVGSALWIADNIGRVNSSGMELSFFMRYAVNQLSARLDGGYSYTRATEANSDIPPAGRKQLIYIPENQANGSLHITYDKFYSIWNSIIKGRVFTSADNSDFLKSYTINNFTNGLRLNLKDGLFDIRFRIENIFNVKYQTIAYYPQPGRSYLLMLTLQFKN